MDFKSKLQKLLTTILESITNSSVFEVTIGKLRDDTTLVINILVPSDKVGLVLGRADQYGLNPMKLAILRICKQASFYYGYKEILIKIGELDGERN